MQTDMATTDKLVSEIKELPDTDKLRLVDAILSDLNKPDAEIDRAWAEEARERWAVYKARCLATILYEAGKELERGLKKR